MIDNGYLIDSEIIFTENVQPKSYTGFKFNGNCILDSVLIRNYEQTDNEILSDSVTIGVEPDWTPDVIFLANFNNTTDASNVSGMSSSPTSWSLYRREKNGDVLYKVCDTDMTINSWIDYKIEGNKTYEYLLFAENDSQVSSPIITDEIKTTFWGWYLISSDADSQDEIINGNVECYKFDLNLQSDKILYNNDFTSLKTYNKFDSTVIGNRNFRSSSFTAMPIPILENGKYDFEGTTRFADLISNLNTFINNNEYKYLKNRNGEIIKVTTQGSNSSFDYQYQDNLSINGSQPFMITIYWQEIGEVYDEDNL